MIELFSIVGVVIAIVVPVLLFGIRSEMRAQSAILEQIFKQLGGQIIERRGFKDFLTSPEAENVKPIFKDN